MYARQTMTEHLGPAFLADLVLKALKKLAAKLRGGKSREPHHPFVDLEEVEEREERTVTTIKTLRRVSRYRGQADSKPTDVSKQ
jgi:hypothetical protein